METLADEMRKYLSIIEDAEADLSGVVGDYIARGSRRLVHAHTEDDSLVVKVQEELSNEQNLREWNYWQQLQNSPFAGYFAPCLEKSPDNRYLVMKKTAPINGVNTDLPAITLVFDAYNYGEPETNLGMLDGRMVCHDYGLCFAPIETVLDAKHREMMGRMLTPEQFSAAGDRIYFEDDFPNGYYSADNMDWILGILKDVLPE